MAVSYYTGDSIPISLTVADSTGTLTPSAATITIRHETSKDEVENGTSMTITGTAMSFTLAPAKTGQLGKYFFIVKATLPNGDTRQYRSIKIVEAP